MRKILIFIFASLIICFFIVNFFRPVSSINYDLGRHLLLGKIIIQTHNVPNTNFLSYNYNNFPFINSHWLSEVVFALINNYFNLNLLIIFSTLIPTIACLIQIWFASKRFLPFSVLLSSTLYLFILANRTDMRPEIFSMLFLSIFVIFLYSFRKSPSKYILLLIPLEALWVNMHIYFFVGPFVIFLFLLENLFVNRLNLSKSAKILSMLLIGSLIATLINPNGIKAAIFPFTVLGNYGLPILENQSIFTLNQSFSNFGVFIFLISLVLLFAFLLLERKHMRPIDWLLSITFSIAGILIYRNILLFTFATFFPFTRSLNFFIKDASLIFKKLLPSKHLNAINNLFIACLILILTLAIAMSIYINGFGFGITSYGIGATDFLVKNKIDGPVFNSFDIGGYLSSRIYPNLIYVDGRPEAYPKSFFEDIYLPMTNDPKIFESENKKYNFNVLFLSHWDQTPWPNPLIKYLLSDKFYSLVYLDSYSAVLLQDNEKNRNIIAKYGIYKNSISLTNINNSQELIRYLFLFEKIGWLDKAKESYTRLKEVDKELCSLKKSLMTLRYRKVSFISEKELVDICQIPYLPKLSF